MQRTERGIFKSIFFLSWVQTTVYFYFKINNPRQKYTMASGGKQMKIKDPANKDLKAESPEGEPTMFYPTDVILKVEEKLFYLNKKRLGENSPVFKAMFEADFKEKHAEVIPLPGKKFKGFEMFLCSFYFPEDIRPITENVAFNKAAHYVTYDALGVRKNANVVVDGRKLYNDGECLSIRNFRRLVIDLGEVLSIHHITTYINVSSGLGFLGINVSKRSDSWDYDCGLIYFFSGHTEYYKPCSFHARYISLSSLTGDTIDFCDVEIYGCRTPGWYGENCSIPCPQNCQEGRCDISEGTCLECINGYGGPRCGKDCDSGTFGRGCRGICGKCKGNNTCNRINGRCMEGCHLGFIGLKCDKECDNNTFGQDCIGVCGNCFKNEHCHHVNGSCLHGCDPGFNGLYCDEEDMVPMALPLDNDYDFLEINTSHF
uniref:Uncharacterized protein LOC111113335 isoform X2 n=1 Tax=Crassostrea virginica TaxID=6565 RepID=A0A8B8BWK3_CRAVI|nr:uncharacterized protein LOC111113335 isoform X2 [Crassostrea virginica]